MKTLILVDLSGLFRAHWHSTQDMELGEAYTRTLASVQKVIAGYDHVAICIDRPPYKRKELMPEYKGQREVPPAQMVEQFARLKERLASDGLLLWGVQGYEADDIIATAVGMARGQELEVMIASSDKDLSSLVSDTDRVRQLSFATGVVFDEAGVAMKFGVPPVLVPDLLALTGDSSDNIPGIKGVGIKTAAELLWQFGSLDDVLSFAGNIKQPKLRESVLTSIEAVKLGRKVIQLATDAPINFSEVFERREPKKLTAHPGFDEAEYQDEPKPDPVAKRPQATPATPGDLRSVVSEVQDAANRELRTPAPDTVPLRPLASATPAQAQTALVVRPEPTKEWALQLEPTTAVEAWKMANALHNSRLFANFANPEAIFAVLLRGRSLGLDAVTSLSNFHVIEGKPTMHAALIVGLILKSGKAEYFELVETTDERAVWATRRKGATREVTMSWDVRDALNAGLLVGTPENATGVSKSGKPSNWDKYRRTMFRWRGAVELGRAVYPDVTAGLYTPDEIGDGIYDPAIEAKHVA